jgi:predicted MPP superfamily phosphohydrolase
MEDYGSSSSETTATTETTEIIILDHLGNLSVEERDRHLEKRRKREERVHYYHSEIWYVRYFDPAALLKLGLKLTGLTGWAEQNMLGVEVRTHILEFESLPSSFHGFRLLHLSDLHIDAHPDLASRISLALQGLEADLCLLTGDYRFGVVHSSPLVESYLELVISSVSSRGGIIGILGNHDSNHDARILENLGVRVLLNEFVEIKKNGQSIYIAGIDDPYAFQCHDLERATKHIPESAFTILLAHTPQLYQDAAQEDIDLYLCGHTHGGQVRLPGVGAIVSKAGAPRQFAYGLWRHGDMTGYTSAGLGVSGTLARINCPPEVVMIELRKKDAD